MVAWLSAVSCLLLAVYSYGFVDVNFPLKPPQFIYNLVHNQRLSTTLIFVFLIGLLFIVYALLLKKAKNKQIDARQSWRLIFLVALILFFSWPAFSYDIFNYIATAKVTFFYKENPYLVMPIEFINEPTLKFTHAANKFALYGPAWILLTFLPYFFGKANVILTVFTFKAFILLFYLGLCWLIWRISRNNLKSLIFFSFNPLVIIETLISSHNDIVMMSFLLLSFYWLFQKKKVLSFLAFIFSIGIKYATLILAPIWLFSSRFNRKQFLTFCYYLLFLVFLLSPLREEIYSWYFIWVLALAALLTENKLIYSLSLSFSFGLLLRYTPYLYTWRWDGITPLIKTLTTFIPPIFSLLFLGLGAMLKRHESRH